MQLEIMQGLPLRRINGETKAGVLLRRKNYKKMQVY